MPGWGEYFAKVYLLRPKIKCNSPHSRPGEVLPIRGQASPSGATPVGSPDPGNAHQERERAPRDKEQGKVDR